MATKILTDNGLTVALMEAGPSLIPQIRSTASLKWPYESPRRGRGSTRVFGDFRLYGDWKVDEPYEMKGDTKFNWWRSRMLEAEQITGEEFLRFGPNDFKRKSMMALAMTGPLIR